MPSRIIREGILSSERVEQLDYPAEVFYRRLMSKVDDYGLYDARPSILRSSLYPLRVDRVREADISRWIAICEKAGLIALYQDGGKPYLQMFDTRWIARSEPKYPLPSKEFAQCVNNCKQLITGVQLDVVVVGVGVGDGWLPTSNGVSDNNIDFNQHFTNKQVQKWTNNGQRKMAKLAKTPVSDGQMVNGFDMFWLQWPKKEKRKRGLEIWKSKHLDDRVDDLIADICWRKSNCYKWTRGYIPNVTTYLNQETWNDERITTEQAKSRKLIGVGNNACYESDDLPKF